MSPRVLAAFLLGLAEILCSGAPAAREIGLVVIHATGGPGCRHDRLWHSPGGSLESIRRYFESNPGIGYHYLIGREGTVLTGVPEGRLAYHARGHNRGSIGIELVNDGDGRDPFPEAQISALIDLLRRLVHTYDLSPQQIRGHSELDSRTFLCGGRRYKQKIDPGGEYPGSEGNFPWKRIRKALE